MKPVRPSFADHPFRWRPHARLDICGRGERPMAFMPENRFGAGAKRGLCWSRSQAGLAIQLLFGFGLRLRRRGAGRDGSSIFEHGSAHNGARFVRIFVRFVRISVRFVRIPVRFVREFREIGADWGVWEGSSPRFSPLPNQNRGGGFDGAAADNGVSFAHSWLDAAARME